MLASRAQAEFVSGPADFVRSFGPYLEQPPGSAVEPFTYVPDRDRLEQVRVITKTAGVPVRAGIDFAIDLLMSEYEWNGDDLLRRIAAIGKVTE